MARLILKSPYLKPGGKKSPGGYLKYIATREGVEMAEDTSRHLPATSEQQKQINALIKKHPQSREGEIHNNLACRDHHCTESCFFCQLYHFVFLHMTVSFPTN